jgi:hypothetical protein
MIRSLICLIVLQAGPVAPAETMDAAIEKIVKLREQQAALKAQEEIALADIKKRYADLASKIDKLLGAAPTPAPTDKLAADLGDLYKLEASPSKKLQALTLANLYKQAAKEAKSPQCETCEDLASLILAFIDGAEGLGPDSLKLLRARVLTELKSIAPNLGAALNDELRAAIGSMYGRVAAILEGVAK